MTIADETLGELIVLAPAVPLLVRWRKWTGLLRLGPFALARSLAHLASRGEEHLRFDADQLLLELRVQASGAVRVVGGGPFATLRTRSFPAKAVCGVRFRIGAPGAARVPLLCHLEYRAGGGEVSSVEMTFTLPGLDQPDEAMDLVFRFANILKFDRMRVRDLDAGVREVDLVREGDEDDPKRYRSEGSTIDTEPVPTIVAPADYRAAEVGADASEPTTGKPRRRAIGLGTFGYLFGCLCFGAIAFVATVIYAAMVLMPSLLLEGAPLAPLWDPRQFELPYRAGCSYGGMTALFGGIIGPAIVTMEEFRPVLERSMVRRFAALGGLIFTAAVRLAIPMCLAFAVVGFVLALPIAGGQALGLYSVKTALSIATGVIIVVGFGVFLASFFACMVETHDVGVRRGIL